MTWYELLTIIGLPSIITMIFQVVMNKISEKSAKSKSDYIALKLGLQALLRNQLLQSYKLYITQGWINIQDKENFNNMYQQYHSLGKNGVMNEVYKEVMGLPLIKK